jgi:hypothetical protein
MSACSPNGWARGTTHVVFEPLELLEKLEVGPSGSQTVGNGSALVDPQRVHPSGAKVPHAWTHGQLTFRQFGGFLEVHSESR